MTTAVGDIRATWTRRLLNVFTRQGSTRRMADRANCPHVEEEGRCARRPLAELSSTLRYRSGMDFRTA